MERRGRVKTGIGAGCLSEKYDSAPEEFKMNAPIEIGILDARGKALAEMQAFLKELWSRPVPPSIKQPERRWTREELYERGRGKRAERN
jgi:hypothetical protein